MTTKDEQETVIVISRADEVVRVYSSIPAHIRKLDSDDRATRRDGDAEQGSFTIPAEQWNPLAFRRRVSPIGADERARRSARLSNYRASRGQERGQVGEPQGTPIHVGNVSIAVPKPKMKAGSAEGGST